MLLDHFLRRQDGVITYAQAREAGLTPTQIKHRKASGRWARVGPQVYFAADRPFSASARLRTAVYSAGRGAAADGLSAAWWHGLTEQLPPVCTVTVPRTRSPRVADSRVRRRDLHHRDLVGFRDLWVTDLALTVLECAVLPGGPALLDRALQRRVRLPQLHAAHERNAGRYGAQRATQLLTVAADRAGSHAERVLLRLLREAGITGWRPNHPVLRYRVVRGVSRRAVGGGGRRLGVAPGHQEVRQRPESAELADQCGMAGAPVHLGTPHRGARHRHPPDSPRAGSNFGALRCTSYS